MKIVKYVGCALLVAAPVHADVTATDVLEKLRQIGDFPGAVFDVETETPTDTGLILENAEFSYYEYDPSERFVVTVPLITLTELADGTVEITVSMKNTATFIDDDYVDEDDSDYNPPVFDIITPDLQILATGTPEAVKFTFSGPHAKIILPPYLVDYSFALTDDEFSYVDENGFSMILRSFSGAVEHRVGDYDVLIDGALTMTEFTLDGWNRSSYGAGNSNRFDFATTIRDIDIHLNEDESSDLAEELVFENLPAMDFLAAFRDAEMHIQFETKYDSVVDGYGDYSMFVGPFSIRAGYTDGQLTAGMFVDAIRGQLDVDAPDLTGVFEASLDRVAYDLNLSVDTDADQLTGSYISSIRNLVLGESIWDEIDDEARIPREPFDFLAHYGLDVFLAAGTLSNPLDEADPETILERARLALEEYSLSAMGVRMEADGELNLDLTDMYGDPLDWVMASNLHVDLKGSMELISDLLEMNLLDATLAALARSAINMVGTEVEEDHFVADLVMDEVGNLTINGEPFDLPD